MTRREAEDWYEDDSCLKTQDQVFAQVIDKVNSIVESSDEEEGVDFDLWEDNEPDFEIFKEEE